MSVSHPVIDPGEITNALGLQPAYSWRPGDPCIPFPGGLPSGTHDDTYWCVPLHEGYRTAESGQQLEVFLAEAVRRLTPALPLLKSIHSSGGSVEFFVGLFGEFNICFSMSPTLLTLLGECGIKLSLDIYPGKPEELGPRTGGT